MLSFLRGEDGRIRGIMGATRDITERKNMEEMLTKIIDGSSIASFVINKQHKVTYWNTAIEALSGIKKGEIIGTDGQWKAFYTENRPVMADLIVDRASADEIEVYYRNKCKKSLLIDGAYEAEGFFPKYKILLETLSRLKKLAPTN
jgi:PAS domain-containing protein